MDLQTSKIELAKLILNLDNPTILLKIKELIQGHEGSGMTLTDSEKEEIKIALDQLNMLESQILTPNKTPKSTPHFCYGLVIYLNVGRHDGIWN